MPLRGAAPFAGEGRDSLAADDKWLDAAEREMEAQREAEGLARGERRESRIHPAQPRLG